MRLQETGRNRVTFASALLGLPAVQPPAEPAATTRDAIANRIEPLFHVLKNRVDPQQHFNRGKLMPGSSLEGAYTPSLRLVQQEAIILEESELGALNDDVKHCLRCGKCKSKCMTHVPRANLYYSPRDKILAIGRLASNVAHELNNPLYGIMNTLE